MGYKRICDSRYNQVLNGCMFGAVTVLRHSRLSFHCAASYNLQMSSVNPAAITSATFLDMLRMASNKNDSMLCVGLDPEPARFPGKLKGDSSKIYDFCAAIVGHQLLQLRLGAVRCKVGDLGFEG